MKERLKIYRFSILAILSLMALPASASAATVYLQSSRDSISIGDTAVITVKIDADGTPINSVEGDIALSSPSTGDFTIQQSSLAGSVFSLWPEAPSISQGGTDISFVGGVPGGFKTDGATIFKMIVLAKAAGSVTVAPQKISVYANDGKGTLVPVQVKNLTVAVSSNKAGASTTDDWASIVSTDTTPPEPFAITVGQDPSMLSGDRYAFFNAVDDQTGIDHYDVIENGAPVVRSDSMYVLQNQNGDVTLNVTAYDKAGNKRTVIYNGQQLRKGISWKTIVISAIVLIILYLCYRKIRSRSKPDKHQDAL